MTTILVWLGVLAFFGGLFAIFCLAGDLPVDER